MSTDKNNKNIRIWQFICIPLLAALIGLIPFIYSEFISSNNDPSIPKMIIKENNKVKTNNNYDSLNIRNIQEISDKSIDEKLNNSNSRLEEFKRESFSVNNNNEITTNDILYFEEKGICTINQDRKINKTNALLGAIECASIVAKANLLKKIEGVLIKDSTVVRNFEFSESKITAYCEGRITKAYQVGEPNIYEDKVEVILRINKNELKNID